jgi:hypothetical protein
MAHYCQSSGEAWTAQLEATLTFPRYFARQDYWRDFPPVHMLVRAIAIGLGAYRPQERATEKENAMATLRALFPGGKI